jgi:hypothetical protein
MPPVRKKRVAVKPADKYDHRETEAQRVYSWRFESFKSMLKSSGLDVPKIVEIARILTDSDAEVRRAEKMLERGCNPLVLVEILT